MSFYQGWQHVGHTRCGTSKHMKSICSTLDHRQQLAIIHTARLLVFGSSHQHGNRGRGWMLRSAGREHIQNTAFRQALIKPSSQIQIALDPHVFELFHR